MMERWLFLLTVRRAIVLVLPKQSRECNQLLVAQLWTTNDVEQLKPLNNKK